MMVTIRILLLASLLLVVGGGLLITHPAVWHTPFASRVLPWVEPGWTTLSAQPSMMSRLRNLGRTVTDVRLELSIGFVAGLAIVVTTGNFVGAIALAAFTFAVVAFTRQQYASRTQRKQALRIAAELPAIAEYLALCSSAGISIEAAARRVPMDFTGLIASALADASDAHTSVLESLAHLASSSPELRQLLDALALSRMRGTPVAQVLGQQAEQMRTREQQQLLAHSGRQEVLMLIPVIFLVFPTVIAVALFPGWQELKHLAW